MVVPVEVNNSEAVVRGVYHKMNFDRSNQLKSNVFRSPVNKDEISVVRLDYCNINFCRSHFKQIEKPEGDYRKYYGFFHLLVHEVRSVQSDVVSSQESFKEHADIIHNYIEVQNQEPPLEIRIKIDKLLTLARVRLEHDLDPLIPWNKKVV